MCYTIVTVPVVSVLHFTLCPDLIGLILDRKDFITGFQKVKSHSLKPPLHCKIVRENSLYFALKEWALPVCTITMLLPKMERN